MGILQWFRNLGRPTETDPISVPVKTVTESADERSRDKAELQKAIKSIEVRLNLIEDEAEIIYRR